MIYFPRSLLSALLLFSLSSAAWSSEEQAVTVSDGSDEKETPALRGTGGPARSLLNKFGFTNQEPTDCAYDILKIVIKTDYFPDESSWKLRDRDNNNAIIAQDGDYAVFPRFRRISRFVCLPPGRYKFTIYDDANDGLCCSSTHAAGYYNVTLNDCRHIAYGSEFNNNEFVNFATDGTDCKMPSVSVSPSVAPSLSIAPSSSPSSAPSRDCNIYERTEYYIKRAQTDEDEAFGRTNFLKIGSPDEDYEVSQTSVFNGGFPTGERHKFKLVFRGTAGGIDYYRIKDMEEKLFVTYKENQNPKWSGTDGLTNNGSSDNDALWGLVSTGDCRTFQLKALKYSNKYVHGRDGLDIDLRDSRPNNARQHWIFTPV